MNGITELAQILKERENSRSYSPLFGTLLSIVPLKIAIGDKIILTDMHIRQTAPIDQKDEGGQYINLGEDVVLLPYADGQKFILIGMVI